MTAATPMITRSRGEDATQESQLRVVFRRFRRHKLAMISAVLLALIFVVSLLAPVITTFPRTWSTFRHRFAPRRPVSCRRMAGRISWASISSAVIGHPCPHAARVSLAPIAILVVLLSESFGTLMGALARLLRRSDGYGVIAHQ